MNKIKSIILKDKMNVVGFVDFDHDFEFEGLKIKVIPENVQIFSKRCGKPAKWFIVWVKNDNGIPIISQTHKTQAKLSKLWFPGILGLICSLIFLLFTKKKFSLWL